MPWIITPPHPLSPDDTGRLAELWKDALSRGTKGIVLGHPGYKVEYIGPQSPTTAFLSRARAKVR